MWWQTACLIRLSGLSRGRAVPLVGWVRHPGRAQVAVEASQELRDSAAWLLPRHGKEILLADRGLAATDLRVHRRRRGWHGRMRITRSLWLSRRGRRRCQVARLSEARGHARLWQQVGITEKRYGPGHRGVARPWQGTDGWSVRRDEPTEEQTCKAYGRRFEIEENVVEEQSKGWQGASSLMRSAQALTRLCCVLAMPTRSRVAQGPVVVTQGKRRWVDPHWLRGRALCRSAGTG
jgi:hypothetical protein